MRHKINKKRIRGIMVTQRYVVAILGIDTQYYTDKFVACLWEEAADKEYNNSSIYVSALIASGTLVCEEARGGTLGDAAYTITCLRNPFEVSNKDDYWNAFRRVILSIREKLDNPNMTITIKDVEYYFL